MARDGSGTMTRVSNSFSSPVTGTTIDPTDADTYFDDVDTELTNSVAVDGQSTMTGQLKAANGTVAAPAYTFGSDLDCGYYRIGANNLGLAIGGVKVADYGAAAIAFSLPVSNTNAILTTPNIGTPSAGVLTSCTGLPIATGVSGLGTGIATALAVNTGSTGAPVLFNGALGTPSSGTLTNCTIPVTGVSSLGTGVATALAVNVGSAGAPVLFDGALGTPSSGTLTNCTIPVSSVSGLGTGVATALAANVGSAGAPVTFNGALGTPASGTLTNCTIPVTGISSLGAGGATFLATPSSANLRSYLTDETGTGSAVFATSPTLVTPVLGAATATTINGAALDNNAWTTSNPTVTAQGGTITAYTATGRYKQIGKTVVYQADVTITTVGTASTGMIVTLPSAAAAFGYAGISTEIALNGRSGRAYIAASGSTLDSREATGTSWFASGNGVRVIIGITYEVA